MAAHPAVLVPRDVREAHKLAGRLDQQARAVHPVLRGTQLGVEDATEAIETFVRIQVVDQLRALLGVDDPVEDLGAVGLVGPPAAAVARSGRGRKAIDLGVQRSDLVG